LANDKTVLIIDDDAYILKVIALKLKNNGYSVVTASDGREGLELIESHKPEVVITDLNMPRMDGETLCKMTNPLKKERKFLTIVLSARINPDDRRWLSQMEDTMFFEKPFSPSQLLHCVNEYFGA
jgi:CheY-like chemotaxis protein